MTDQGYRHILHSMPVGYVLCKIIMSEEGLPRDFEFIEANGAFEEATSLKASDIIGKNLSEVFPGINKYKPDWIWLFSDIAFNGQNKIFEQYSHELKKWFKINSYLPEKGYFVALVTDITREKEHSMNLADSNRLLTDFLNSCSDMIYLKDDKFRHLFVNKALAAFLGKAQGDIIGKDDFSLYPSAMAETCRASDESVKESGCRTVSEETVSDRTYETVKFPVSYPNGTLGIGAFIKDITERKALSDERERLLAQMDAMFSEHEAVMLLIEPDSGKIIDSNPSASLFYGYSREELLNMGVQEISQLSLNEVMANRDRILNKEQACYTCLHKLKNGQIKSVDVYSSPISYNGKTVLFSIVIDVTKREEALREIVYINYHDYLTGVYNRRFFEEEFDRLNIADNFPITVLMGDINGLKLINDSLGHHAGDNLIKEAAGKIAKNLRSNDVFARIGGDEFGVIMLKTDEDAANAIVKRIKRGIECNTDGTAAENRLLSISFGFAVQKAACDALGVLMKEAEGYLYNKKYYDSRSLKSKAVDIIMNTLFEKSPRDKMHSERVGNISALIAESLGLEKERVDKIRVAGWLHDIGKIGIPEYVLNKESGLGEEEWAIMKTHPEKGWRILENTYEFSEVSDIVLYHHEKWDGSGYPMGLKGEEIPLETRIISVADAYDAMAYNRSYRGKIKPTEAIKELRRCSGTHFDSEIIEVFVKYVLKNEKDMFSKSASEPII